MGEIEIGYCDICHQKEQVLRKYYYYDIDCKCCGGPQHFECVRYCKNCEPKPPKRISAIIEPAPKENRRINPEYWEYYE